MRFSCGDVVLVLAVLLHFGFSASSDVSIARFECRFTNNQPDQNISVDALQQVTLASAQYPSSFTAQTINYSNYNYSCFVRFTAPTGYRLHAHAPIGNVDANVFFKGLPQGAPSSFELRSLRTANQSQLLDARDLRVSSNSTCLDFYVPTFNSTQFNFFKLYVSAFLPEDAGTMPFANQTLDLGSLSEDEVYALSDINDIFNPNLTTTSSLSNVTISIPNNCTAKILLQTVQIKNGGYFSVLDSHGSTLFYANAANSTTNDLLLEFASTTNNAAVTFQYVRDGQGSLTTDYLSIYVAIVRTNATATSSSACTNKTPPFGVQYGQDVVVLMSDPNLDIRGTFWPQAAYKNSIVCYNQLLLDNPNRTDLEIHLYVYLNQLEAGGADTLTLSTSNGLANVQQGHRYILPRSNLGSALTFQSDDTIGAGGFGIVAYTASCQCSGPEEVFLEPNKAYYLTSPQLPNQIYRDWCSNMMCQYRIVTPIGYDLTWDMQGLTRIGFDGNARLYGYLEGDNTCLFSESPSSTIHSLGGIVVLPTPLRIRFYSGDDRADRVLYNSFERFFNISFIATPTFGVYGNGTTAAPGAKDPCHGDVGTWPSDPPHTFTPPLGTPRTSTTLQSSPSSSSLSPSSPPASSSSSLSPSSSPTSAPSSDSLSTSTHHNGDSSIKPSVLLVYAAILVVSYQLTIASSLN